VPPEIEEAVTWRCTICSREYDEENQPPEGTLHNGEAYCENCADQTVECYHCENLYEAGDDEYYVLDDGERNVCYSCYNDNGYLDCPSCDETIYPDDSRSTEDGPVCSYCFDENYDECNECGSIVAGTYYFLEEEWCEECARRKTEQVLIDAVDVDNEGDADDDAWEECLAMLREVFPMLLNVNAFGVSGQRFICVSCGEGRFGLPSGDHVAVARMLIEGNFTGAVCGRCIHSEAPTSYRVLNYSHKPRPQWKRTHRDLDKRSLHFGTEVEVDMAKGVSRDLALKQIGEADEERLFYCKHDQSCGHGFEIVTHPFTFDWMKDNPDAFSPMFELAPIMRGWEAERCGMHIHMSKDAFSELQMFKFMRFFHMNMRFIRSLARRPTGKFDKWARMEVPERNKLMKFTLAKAHIDFDRGALNPEPADTLECRIFRSTLSPTAYYGNIEFLQSLFDYTKNCGVDDDQLSEQRFMDYTRERGRRLRTTGR
jgi:hypothetical protein